LIRSRTEDEGEVGVTAPLLWRALSHGDGATYTVTVFEPDTGRVIRVQQVRAETDEALIAAGKAAPSQERLTHGNGGRWL
jgi:hypothetical protein